MADATACCPHVREMAERILLLHDLSLGRACRRCHGRPVNAPQPSYRWHPTYLLRCANGHEWQQPFLVEGNTMNPSALLGLLARGEPLPDLPAKEDGDGPA